VRISNVRNSFYQTEKPQPITAPLEALSAGVSASKTARKNSLAALHQKVESSNSAFAIPLQALIDFVFNQLSLFKCSKSLEE
jgi:BioD-like phosphotransacetylase family protein